MLDKLNSKLPSDLTIPRIPPLDNVICTWMPDSSKIQTFFPIIYENAESENYFVPMKRSILLSSCKKTYEVDLDCSHFSYEAGDTLGICCKNFPNEIDEILSRLDLTGEKDEILKVQFKKLPLNIHKCAPYICHLYDLFSFIFDIRAIPKKSFLCVLAQFTSDPIEKQRLLQLCSKEGGLDYNIIQERGFTFMHILQAFPSCKPSLEIVLDNLPPLQPRAYSFSSCQYVDSSEIRFVFTPITLPPDEYYPQPRRGLCTGHLVDLCEQVSKRHKEEDDHQLPKIAIFKRSNPFFKLPHTLNPSERPHLFMFLAPGTGIAPFLSFFQQMGSPKSPQHKFLREGLVESWLYYGCRHPDQDLIYKDELISHTRKTEGLSPVISRLYLSFSRLPPNPDDNESNPDIRTLEQNFYGLSFQDIDYCRCPRYIQDNLWATADLFMPRLMQGNATIYLTGDARGISRSMKKCISEIVQMRQGCGVKEGDAFVKKLQMEKRFLEDTWL